MFLINIKILCFSLFATICYSMVINTSKSLRYPASLHISVNDGKDEPLSLDIFWKKVESVDDDDPVIGYKVKVIEVEKVKRIINKVNNETHEIEQFEVEEYPKINAHKTPEGRLTELIAPASDKPGVRFEGLKLGVPFEVTVLAYTKNLEGPSSAPTRTRVHDS